MQQANRRQVDNGKASADAHHLEPDSGAVLTASTLQATAAGARPLQALTAPSSQRLTGPPRGEQGAGLQGVRPSRAASAGSWGAVGAAAAALPSGCHGVSWMTG